MCKGAEWHTGHSRTCGQDGSLTERRLGDIHGQACARQRRSKCTKRTREKQWRVSVGAEEKVKRCLPPVLSFPAATTPPMCAFKTRLPQQPTTVAKKGVTARDVTGINAAFPEVLETMLIHEGLTCGIRRLTRPWLSTVPVFVFLHPTASAYVCQAGGGPWC